jgi:hypothetical protein
MPNPSHPSWFYHPYQYLVRTTWWSASSCNYLQYPHSSSLLGPNSFLSTRSWCYFNVKDRVVVNISYAYGEWRHMEQTDKEGVLERGQLSSLRFKVHCHCRRASKLPPVTAVKISHKFYLCSLMVLAVASTADVTSLTRMMELQTVSIYRQQCDPINCSYSQIQEGVICTWIL